MAFETKENPVTTDDTDMEIDEKVLLVDIEGIDKVDLLRALCKNAKHSQLNMFYKEDDKFNENAAHAIVKKDKVIKYFNGRPIYCNIFTNKVDPTKYDRHIEAAKKSKSKEKKAYNTFQEIVSSMDIEM